MSGGGKSQSDSSVTTTNNTTNHVFSTDGRIVASDAAVAVSGSGTAIRNDTTVYTDSSNRSTNFTDNSVRDSGNVTTTKISTTDHGAVKAAIDGMGNMGSLALNFSRDSIKGALDGLNASGKNQLDAFGMALNFAEKAGANSLTSANQILGYAKDSVEGVKAAFAEAQAGPDQKVLLALLAAIGVIGVAFALKD